MYIAKPIRKEINSVFKYNFVQEKTDFNVVFKGYWYKKAKTMILKPSEISNLI